MKKHQDAQIAATYTSAMDHDPKVQKKENGGQTATTSRNGSEGGSTIDVAAQYTHHFADSGDTYSPKEEQRLRWRLDLRLVPLL
ncbi:MFS general substrate transporter [Apiospora arundinis]